MEVPPIARLKENSFDFVHDSQKVFRTLMSSLAFPGKINHLESLPLSISQSDIKYILQPFLCLLDLETSASVYSLDVLKSNTITQYLTINTGCQMESHRKADYILCLEPTLNGRYSELKPGSLSNPNKSATIFYLVNRIYPEKSTGSNDLVLSGPGIKSENPVSVHGLDSREITSWNLHRHTYPVGVDIFLVSKTGEIIAIPRSVNIRYIGGN